MGDEKRENAFTMKKPLDKDFVRRLNQTVTSANLKGKQGFFVVNPKNPVHNPLATPAEIQQYTEDKLFRKGKT